MEDFLTGLGIPGEILESLTLSELAEMYCLVNGICCLSKKREIQVKGSNYSTLPFQNLNHEPITPSLPLLSPGYLLPVEALNAPRDM